MKNKKSLKINPLILFLFCFLLYPPTLKVFPIATYIITIALPVVYILFNRKIIKTIIKKKQLVVLFLSAALVVMSLLVPIIYTTDDFSYMYVTTYILRKMLVYVALLCTIIKKHGDKQAVYHFMYYFALTHVIHVIGTLILVLISTVNNFWFSIFSKSAVKESMFDSYGYTFRIGWQGFAGFRLTLYCTISVIFSLFLAYGFREKKIDTRHFVILFVGCLFGNMFYGRIGIIMSAMVSVIAFLYWNRKRIKRIIAAIALVAVMVASVIFLKNLPLFNEWGTWMSKPIENFITTGDFDNASYDTLIDMSRMEIADRTLLVGDGRYSDASGGYYRKNDVGYIRNILFWGIIGCVATYYVTLYSLSQIGKISKMILLQTVLVFVVFEFKGAVYYEFIPLAFALGAAYNLAVSHRDNAIRKRQQ